MARAQEAKAAEETTSGNAPVLLDLPTKDLRQLRLQDLKQALNGWFIERIVEERLSKSRLEGLQIIGVDGRSAPAGPHAPRRSV